MSGSRQTYTPEEAAELLGVSVSTIYRHGKTKAEMGAIQLGSTLRFAKAKFDAHLGITNNEQKEGI